MKSERLLRLCERVFGSLDRAVVEGYENVLVNSAEETAAEIGEYDSKLGDVPTDVRRPSSFRLPRRRCARSSRPCAPAPRCRRRDLCRLGRDLRSVR
jgi:hypothetical protein